MENKNLSMVMYMRDSIKMVNLMEKVNIRGKIMFIMKDNF